MPDLAIKHISIEHLKPYTNHTRNHSKSKVKKLAKLIHEFGFLIPIVVDAQNKNIVTGHARLLAAVELGLEKVPIIQVEHLTPEQIRAFRIADNKISEGSEWSLEALKIELIELKDLDFDLSLTAFEIPEIDLIILGEDGVVGILEDEIPAIPKDPTVRIGDLFAVGKHRAACIDCQDFQLMQNLMNGQLVSLVVTDPPYNVKINGHVLSKTRAHGEFAMASGEMKEGEYTNFLTSVFSVFYQFSNEGSLHYHFIDHKHVEEMIKAGKSVYDDRLNICVWNKTNAGMGSFYRSQHEFCCIFKKGEEPHTNNIQLGKYGRYRTNVWSYPGMNTFSENRDELLSAHPTVKNTQMIADIILDASKPDEVVLDGFLGSGTTLLAAEQTGRVCYGAEIEPKYVEVCIARFQAISDEPVIHLETGLTFEELKQLRTNEAETEANHVG